MGKIHHTGKQDSLLEIWLCTRLFHCFVLLGEIRGKGTRQWTEGTVGTDGVFGVWANGYWKCKVAYWFVEVLGQVPQLVVVVRGFWTSQSMILCACEWGMCSPEQGRLEPPSQKTPAPDLPQGLKCSAKVVSLSFLEWSSLVKQNERELWFLLRA